MIVLSYGYQKPETGDKGDPLFQALEENIQRLNDHSHDGIDSSALTAQSIVGISDTISSANWVAYGPTGHYRQLVTVIAGFNFDTVGMSFRLTTGEMIYPTVEKFAATQYYIYTTDNTQDILVVYGG